MMEILHEDECNDTYGRERMHKALPLNIRVQEYQVKPRYTA